VQIQAPPFISQILMLLKLDFIPKGTRGRVTRRNITLFSPRLEKLGTIKNHTDYSNHLRIGFDQTRRLGSKRSASG